MKALGLAPPAWIAGIPADTQGTGAKPERPQPD
jgi:hypothetical protein